MLSVRRCELHAVAFGEGPLRFTVERHALQAARIVAGLLATFAPDREQVFFCIDTFHARIFSGFDAMRLAAFRVAYDVARFILLGPLTVCAGDLLPGDEHSHVSLPVVHLAGLLHFRVDHPVDFHARLVVG